MSTIYILWLRQIKRYMRSPSRLIGSLGQPILFMVALGFGFSPVFKKAGDGNYMNFLVPGIIAQGIIFTAIFSGIEVVWDRQFGFLKETLVAPVSRIEIMIGRTIGGATIATIQGLLIMAISFVTGFRPANILSVPLAILIMFLTSFLFTALGTAIGSTLEDFHGFQLIMNFLVMPLFFLSGAIFPLKGLPDAIYFLSLFNPLSYGVDGLRTTLAGISHFGIVTDIAVICFFSIIFMSLGSYFFSKIEL